MANQGTSRPVPLHLQPFAIRWDHGHVSEVDGIIRIAPICSTQWLSIFCLHWSWFSPTASKLQISNIKYHIQACIRDVSLQNSMETLQYIESYLTYLFALTEMHFLSQKLEHAWLRKFSCWVVLSCRTRIRNAINEFLEQANVKTSCTLKCGSSGGKHHQTPVLVFIFFPRLKMIMLLGSGSTMYYYMVATGCLSSHCLSHNSSQFSKLLVRTDRSCSPLPSWFGWGECFRIF